MDYTVNALKSQSPCCLSLQHVNTGLRTSMKYSTDYSVQLDDLFQCEDPLF